MITKKTILETFHEKKKIWQQHEIFLLDIP